MIHTLLHPTFLHPTYLHLTFLHPTFLHPTFGQVSLIKPINYYTILVGRPEEKK